VLDPLEHRQERRWDGRSDVRVGLGRLHRFAQALGAVVLDLA
jgi:hypothetical protein